MSTYHVCLSQSGLPHSGPFFLMSSIMDEVFLRNVPLWSRESVTLWTDHGHFVFVYSLLSLCGGEYWCCSLCTEVRGQLWDGSLLPALASQGSTQVLRFVSNGLYPLGHLTGLALFLGDKVTSCSPGCETDSPVSASCWNYRLFHTWQSNELHSNMANLFLARYLTVSSSSSKNETLIIFTGLPQSFSIIMKHPSMARHSKCYLSLFSHNKKFVK